MKFTLRVDIDFEKLAEAELLDGVCIFKTDRQDLSVEQLWHLYMVFQRVERSFRYLKTTLGVRPILHHIEHRSDAHIFIAILACHLLHTIEQLCRVHGDQRSWPTLSAELDTRQAVTVEMDDASGRRHHLRLVTKQTESQKQIYRLPGMSDCTPRTRRYVVEPPGSDETEEAVVST
ncbi:MAG: hypothetical protein EA384_01655 [Spirochaetaceae bacterium]|nr:MAG: hypothetical protein EA384_01655 [Spirochaetaceae bacterium]